MPECTIEIKDEVNVKIHDLDLVTRRQLEKKFKYFLNGHRSIPWECFNGVRRQQPGTGQLNSQGICLQDTRRTPFQAYILSWTPAELDFG